MTRHILKMAVVQTSKRRLGTITLVKRYEALKEIDGGQSCSIYTAKRYSVAKTTFSLWLKRQLKYLKQFKETMFQKDEKNEACNIQGGVGLCHL